MLLQTNHVILFGTLSFSSTVVVANYWSVLLNLLNSINCNLYFTIASNTFFPLLVSYMSLLVSFVLLY